MDKIDTENQIKLESNNTMNPVYSTDIKLLCGIINYNGKTYYIDFDDKDNIINFDKKFVFAKEDDIYPSYYYNYKRFTYLDFIFKYNSESVHYIFKNGNPLDLRRNNVNIFHFYHKQLAENYTIIEYIEGHTYKRGQDANIMKNPLWKIEENGKEYLLMYCEKDTICKLCPVSYQKILDFEQKNEKKITWYKHQNGYILCSDELYIHQIITGCYGNGKGTKQVSVDHIDRNPLNNTFENLRIATREEQEKNSKGIADGTKRARKTSAQKLPEEITHEMMKKYVYYCHEWRDKEKTKERDFFRVEKHPKLNKPWSTSKSTTLSIKDKLEQANKYVEELDKL